MVTYPELQNFSSYDDGRASPAEEAENGEQEEGAKSEKKVSGMPHPSGSAHPAFVRENNYVR